MIGRILRRTGSFVTWPGLLVGLLCSVALPRLSARQAATATSRIEQRREGTALASMTGDEPVVTVTGQDCRGRDFERAGFVATVDQEAGIITTLHGVVGCRNVSARIGDATVSSLLITMVDVRRDVAFITGDGVTSLSSAGPPPVPADRRASAGASPTRRLVIDLRRGPIAALASVIDADDLTTLRERRSPDPRIAVHAPATGYAPGSLGAPAIDAAGATVGVRNGIARAVRPVTWVLARDELDWTPPVQNETEMDRLATLTTLLW